MKLKKISSITLLFLLLFPFAAFAQLPVTGPTSIPDLLARIAQFIFKLVIPLATVALIWSGILFMTAGGNEDRVKKAKGWFLWAIIGLIVSIIGTGFVGLIKDILGSR